MDRLTQQAKFPLDRFRRCQLCGYTGDQITDFQMWWECDEQDKPEPYSILVTCRSKQCGAVIDQHPRGYRAIPWGQGKPGHLILLCGKCRYRNGSHCTHPDLKVNGGAGLQLHQGGLPKVTVCYHSDPSSDPNGSESQDGGLRCDFNGFPNPFFECEGFEATE